jgi:hypothetical protein
MIALDTTLARGQLTMLKHVLYDACDNAKNRQVFDWIESKGAREGHCILLYMSIRNKLKSHPLYVPLEFERVLVQALFCLVRIAEDCVAARHVNGFVKQAELFGIFLDKVRKWLLPFESRVIVNPAESSPSWMASLGLAKQPTAEWPGLGEVYNSWPTVARTIALLREFCEQHPVESHVRSHWGWCQYTSLEWLETIHFGDIPKEIVDTFTTNERAA